MFTTGSGKVQTVSPGFLSLFPTQTHRHFTLAGMERVLREEVLLHLNHVYIYEILVLGMFGI